MIWDVVLKKKMKLAFKMDKKFNTLLQYGNHDKNN